MQLYFVLFVEIYSDSPRDKIQYSDAQFNYYLKDPKVVPSIYKLIAKKFCSFNSTMEIAVTMEISPMVNIKVPRSQYYFLRLATKISHSQGSFCIKAIRWPFLYHQVLANLL